MQNFVATLALALYPFVAVCLFSLQPLSKAILWTVLIAQLFLPVGALIKFEQIPQFDKSSIPSLCLLLGCIVAERKKRLVWRSSIFVSVFSAMFLFGPIVTSEMNGETLRFGDRILPGVGIYDAGSAFLSASIALIPYFVGRYFLNDENDVREILRVLVLSFIGYSVLLLAEVRLSPQMHYWIYGYYPSVFAQSVRDGSFRPMVFMGHGLIAAHFTLLALLAAVGFWRTRTSVLQISPRATNNFRAVSIYLAVVLFFCRTLGAGIYAITIAPIILSCKARTQMRVALLFVVLALLYPTFRYFDLIPTKFLVETSNALSADRGQSLEFRFDNENILLKHAVEKPFFGWGRFGRNRVYDAYSGRDLTLPDGEWIIALGQFGIVGFIAEFGLLSFSVFRAASALRYARSEKEEIYLSVLGLLVALSIFDLLPNAFLSPWTWLISGALLGRSEAILSFKNATKPARVKWKMGQVEA